MMGGLRWVPVSASHVKLSYTTTRCQQCLIWSVPSAVCGRPQAPRSPWHNKCKQKHTQSTVEGMNIKTPDWATPPPQISMLRRISTTNRNPWPRRILFNIEIWGGWGRAQQFLTTSPTANKHISNAQFYVYSPHCHLPTISFIGRHLRKNVSSHTLSPSL